jgi:hypothetical protein
VYYYFFYGSTHAQLEIQKLRKQYKPGENVCFDLKVTNLSKTEKCFVVESKLKFGNDTVQFPRMLSIISEKQNKKFEYSHNLSTDTLKSDYKLQVQLKSKILDKEHVVSSQEFNFLVVVPVTTEPEKSATSAVTVSSFSVRKTAAVLMKPVKNDIKAVIKFVNIPETVNYNEILGIHAEITNVSKVDGKLQLKIELIPSVPLPGVNTEPEVFVKEVYVLARSSITESFAYKVGRDKADGDYLLTAQLYPYTDNKLGDIVASDNFVTSIIDKPPTVTVINPELSVKKQQQVKYTVEVADDREIKEVVFYYVDTVAGTTTNYYMDLVDGNNMFGVWSYSPLVDKKTTKFDFYIKAVDSKSQESITDTFSVSVVKK